MPLVQHLHICATHWEQELQKEVSSMITIFNATKQSISKQKSRNKVLQNDADRLLEYVLNADIISVIMNALYESGTSIIVDDQTADNNLAKHEIETLKQENERISKHNDDVQSKLSNENFQLNQKLQWCQTQSLDFEFQLQSQNVLKSCQNCNVDNENEVLKSQLLKYEKEIEKLKVENAEWQQNRNGIFHFNKRLASN